MVVEIIYCGIPPYVTVQSFVFQLGEAPKSDPGASLLVHSLFLLQKAVPNYCTSGNRRKEAGSGALFPRLPLLWTWNLTPLGPSFLTKPGAPVGLEIQAPARRTPWPRIVENLLWLLHSQRFEAPINARSARGEELRGFNITSCSLLWFSSINIKGN